MSKKKHKNVAADTAAPTVRATVAEQQTEKQKTNWLGITMAAVITAAVSQLVNWGVSRITPLDPRIEAQIKQVDAQIKQLETEREKDSWIIQLAQNMTGNANSQTVERVKRDLSVYLCEAMKGYATKEEFIRDKHRYCDKEKGVIWQTEFRNGNMYSYVIAPYTNSLDDVKR